MKQLIRPWGSPIRRAREKTAIVVFALAVAACGGSKSNAESPTGGAGEPMVDPTVPSWTPPSCATYQKAVTQAIACDAIEQATRDSIQQAYDEASAAWKAEADASAERVAEVSASCTTSAESVQAELTGKCGPATEAP